MSYDSRSARSNAARDASQSPAVNHAVPASTPYKNVESVTSSSAYSSAAPAKSPDRKLASASSVRLAYEEQPSAKLSASSAAARWM